MSSDEWVEVASLEELPPGKVVAAQARGQRLALVNLDGVIHAVGAVCPHRGGPLDQGDIWRGRLECPWHHFRFDLTTGANVYPANVYPSDRPELRSQLKPLKVFPVRVERGRILAQMRPDVKS